MQAILIVELKILAQPSFCISYRLIILEIHLLILDTSPKSFHENVVQCSSSAIPTDANPRCFEASSKIRAGKLRSLVIVENFWSRSLKCLLECCQAKRCF